MLSERPPRPAILTNTAAGTHGEAAGELQSQHRSSRKCAAPRLGLLRILLTSVNPMRFDRRGF